MKFKEFTRKYRSVWLILLFAMVASVMYPFMAAGEFVGGQVTDSQLVYRESLFGPSMHKVTFDNGMKTYVTVYPWYYFRSIPLTPMEITGVSAINSYASSDVITVTWDHPGQDYSMTFTEQNLLWRDDTFLNLNDGPQTCVWTRLALYDGKFTGGITAWQDSFCVLDAVDRCDVEFEYGETWTTTLTIDGYDLYYPGVYEFTVGEWMADVPFAGYLSDMCWIEVIVPVPEDVAEEQQRGSITVNVWDDRIPIEADFNMYRDGVYVDTYHTSTGSRTISNLPFGSYNFVVSGNFDYETKFYDANPCQADFNFDDGVVELSANVNTVNYIIYGDDTTTDDDPYGDLTGGTGDCSEVNDFVNETVERVDEALGGDDGAVPTIFDLITKLFLSLGLFGIVLLGLPLFLVLGFLVCGLFYLSGGEKNGK